jgi:hypothetical protein
MLSALVRSRTWDPDLALHAGDHTVVEHREENLLQITGLCGNRATIDGRVIEIGDDVVANGDRTG